MRRGLLSEALDRYGDEHFESPFRFRDLADWARALEEELLSEFQRANRERNRADKAEAAVADVRKEVEMGLAKLENGTAHNHYEWMLRRLDKLPSGNG